MKALEHRLQRHLGELSTPRNPYRHPEAHERARRYLRESLQDLGRAVCEQPFQDPDYGRGVNLLGLPREGQPKALLVAHYDTVNDSPGADDNGSAVAVALEVARESPKLAILLPDLEECGLLGAHHFVGSGLLHDCPALVLESVGYFSDEPHSQEYPAALPTLFPEAHRALADRFFRGDFLALLHLARDTPWAGRFLRAFGDVAAEGGRPLDLIPLAVPEQLLIQPEGEALRDFGRSDHLAFWQAGRPCLMLTDSANFRNPNYHQPSDRPETLDLGRMGRLTDSLAVALVRS